MQHIVPRCCRLPSQHQGPGSGQATGSGQEPAKWFHQHDTVKSWIHHHHPHMHRLPRSSCPRPPARHPPPRPIHPTPPPTPTPPPPPPPPPRVPTDLFPSQAGHHLVTTAPLWLPTTTPPPRGHRRPGSTHHPATISLSLSHQIHTHLLRHSTHTHSNNSTPPTPPHTPHTPASSSSARAPATSTIHNAPQPWRRSVTARVRVNPCHPIHHQHANQQL